MPEENTAANAGSVSITAPETPATSSTETTQDQGQTQESNVSTQNSEPAQSQQSQQSDVSQTQAFSQRFNQWRDKFIADQGYTDAQGNPIQSYDEYQEALRAANEARENAQIQEETGIDPTKLTPVIQKLVEKHPLFQAVQKQQHDSMLVSEYNGLLSSLEKYGIKDAVKEPNDIPAAVWQKWNDGKSGLSLADAYYLTNRDQILTHYAKTAQQSAVNQILNNGQSSPGPLSGGAPQASTSVWDMSKDDFQKMQERALNGELSKN